MRLAETRVKVRELSLEWFPTSTMALTLVQQLVISCDFNDLRTLRVKNNNIIMWERTKDEKRLVLNGIAAGLPSSMLDDCYALYSAIAEKAKGIVLMDFIITKEIFHRPILSKFSNALKQLDLRIHSLSTNPAPTSKKFVR